MSVDVIAAVLETSQTRGVDRCVMLALADPAHKDGVTWLHQTTIAQRANCSEREVRNAIAVARELGEIERRVVQIGRVRRNVYRICLEPVGQRDVEYERIPWQLDRPFSNGRPAEVAARNADDDRQRLPAVEVVVALADDRQSTTVTTGNPRHDDRQVRAAQGTVLEPSVEPSGPGPVRNRRTPALAIAAANPDLTGSGVDLSRVGEFGAAALAGAREESPHA